MHPSQLALFHIGRDDGAAYFYCVMELADPFTPGRPLPQRGDKPDSPATNRKPMRLASTTKAEAEKWEPAAASETAYVSHTLRAELEAGRLPLPRVVEIGIALTEALLHLHRHCLVHRDVKPSNVVFVDGRPKLADIGLVTDVSDARSIVGTEGYLAPEGPGTPQADLYALGKLLYEAATGMDRRQFPDLPPDLRAWPDSDVAFELNEILIKACATGPGDRYADATALLSDLSLLQQGSSLRWIRRREQAWALGKKAAGVVAAVTALVGIAVVALRLAYLSQVSPEGPPSTNVEANALCEGAFHFIRGDVYSLFPEAWTNFHLAIDLDTNFIRPYAGLLELQLRESKLDGGAWGRPGPLQIADKLARLGPGLAVTYTAQSIRSFAARDFSKALEFGAKSVRTAPGYDLGHTWYCFVLARCGWPDQARKEADVSLNLAPSKATVYRVMGHTYFAQSRFPDAIRWYRQAIAREHHHLPAYRFLVESYESMNDFTNAIGIYQSMKLLTEPDGEKVEQECAALRTRLRRMVREAIGKNAGEKAPATARGLFTRGQGCKCALATPIPPSCCLQRPWTSAMTPRTSNTPHKCCCSTQYGTPSAAIPSLWRYWIEPASRG